MYIKLLNGEKYARVKKLAHVTVPFKNSPGGLFDPEIFGVTEDEKAIQEAAFDLGKFYIAPMFLSAAKVSWGALYQCATSPQTFKIVDGVLEKCDPSDPEAGNGVGWLYENYNKLDTSKLLVDIESQGVLSNKLAKNRMAKISRDEMFTRTQYIMPLAYRSEDDADESVIITNEVNQLLESLMTAVNIRKMPAGEVLDKNNLDSMIQIKLMNIYEFVVGKFAGSHGDGKKAILSRVVTNSGRLVLVPNEYRSKKIGGGRVSLNRAGVPIREVLKFYIDFIIRGSRMFIENLFTIGAFKELDRIYIDSFDFEFINTRIEMFDKSPASRLEPVMIPYQDREEEPVTLDFELEDGTIVNKPLTWIEFFYIVCVDYAKIEDNKWILKTRYPTLTSKNSKTSRVHVLTLLQYDMTKTVTVMGRKYEEFYPWVDDDVREIGIDRIFENGLRLDATVTKGFDGDHDGDQISMKPIWSKEASEENERLQHELFVLTGINGEYARHTDRDPYQTFYSFTQDKAINGTSKPLKDYTIVEEILGTGPDDFTEAFIYDNFCAFGTQKAKYSLYDTISIKYNGKTIDTTLGRLIINKCVFGHIYGNKHWEFVNRPITGNVFAELMDYISQLCIEDKFESRTFIRLVDIMIDFTMRFSTLFNAGVSYEVVMPDEEYHEFRTKKFDAVSEQILKETDVDTFEKTKAEIVEFAKKKYKNNTQTELYNSGAKPKWNDDFAEMYVAMGAMPSLVGGKPTIIINALSQGLGVENLPANANVAIYGAYSAAKSTALAGTIYKRLGNGLASIKGVKGDCGSTHYAPFVGKNWKDLVNKYTKGPKGPVLITLDNVDKYIGKEIMLRDPIYCKMHGDNYCSTCLGEAMFKVANMGDTIPLGAYTQEVGSRLLNLFMVRTA